jgi:hypothetical protein
MHVTEITVSAARTFNHPYEAYANFKPAVSLKATLAPGEDPANATKQLQQQAETLVEDHKNALLTSVHELHRMSEAQQRAAELGRQIAAAQDKLDTLRKEYPDLPSFLALPAAQAKADEEDDEDFDEFEPVKPSDRD